MRQSNVQFIVQALPSKEAEFRERLQALSGKSDFYFPQLDDIPGSLKELQRHNIRQCVVGPEHFAFLLEDGKVCRLKYSAQDGESEDVVTDPTASTPTATKPFSAKPGERPAKFPRTGTSPWIISGTDISSGSSALRRWGTHIGVIRSMATSLGSSSLTTSSGTNAKGKGKSNNGSDAPGSVGSNAAGVRLVRTSQLRGRGLTNSLLSGQRVIVPASHVPEELISQVQGILQGKSRSVIVRELQKTNLDVNLAVNNLLSRDDEDNEDMDDNGNDYMPGEDLLSLLDSGIHPGDHGVFIDTDVLPDDILGYTFHRASRTSSNHRGTTVGGETTASRAGDQSQDRDPIIRLRSPRFFEPLCSYESDQDEPAQQSTAKKSKVTKPSASVNLGDELDWWMEDGKCVKFIQLGAMQSELAAIDVSGNLRQWRWNAAVPFCHLMNPKIFHPRTQFLGLESKKVVHLAACCLRASVLVENGGVATWIDDSVASHASVLEHSVTECVDPDLVIRFNSKKHKGTENKCLHVCSLYSVAFTTSGDIYWWGVLPFHLRKKVLEKAQSKLKRTLAGGKQPAARKPEVKLGSMVCLRRCPMFQAGAKAILMRDGRLKVGCLQQSAWELTDKCVFKILKRKPSRSKRRAKKKESDSKEYKLKGTLPSLGGGELAPKEVPVIQSTSKRETVLKSTSATVFETTQMKFMKRKHTSEATECEKDSVMASKSKGRGDDSICEDLEEDSEEMCNVQDVIFIEDLQTIPVGRVLKVDGDMVAVLFSKYGKLSEEKIDKRSILNDLRLLRKEDLHVMTTNAPPKVPECFLKSPRKIPLDSSLKIHALCVNELGIEAIEGGTDGSPLRHVSINMLGRMISDNLSTPSKMFLCGDSERKGFACEGEEVCKLDQSSQDFFTILRDRNSCLYPLIRNDNSSIRDPHWLNVGPVMAIGRGTHVQSKSSQGKDENTKAKVLAVSALVFKSDLLMPIIILRDHKNVKRLLENASVGEVQMISDERCDGLRNILHVAVSVTTPQNGNDISDDGVKGKKNKEIKKRDAYRLIPLTTSTNAAPVPDSKESDTSAPTTGSLSRNVSGSKLMSQSERVDAVNAIASAISVVTRGERIGSDVRPRTSSRDLSTASSDPFVMSSQCRPSYSVPPLPSSGFSSRFMRDMMQQFAAVLDDHPSSSGSSSSVTTSSSPKPSVSSKRQTPTIIHETRHCGLESSEMPLPYTSSHSPAIPTSTWPPEEILSSAEQQEGLNLSTSESSSGPSNQHSGKSSKKNKRKRSTSPLPHEYHESALKIGNHADALAIIKTLCSAETLEPVLYKLMSQKDAMGHTPFMSAIYLRAYPAAIELFKQIQTIAQKQYDLLFANRSETSQSKYHCSNPEYEEILMSMIYPKKSNPDANPLYVLCANDTCSFTWTGAQHINQDIFECWTCGLTGTLCCCSECARVCHNGHDCKLKRTSPTAYCDCWEKCACRSLIAGDTPSRANLLQKLLHETNLVDHSNSRGETMLNFLAQTVARQSVEQRQYRTRSVVASSRTSHTLKTNVNQEYNVPRHDLQPPMFCREAFLNLLHDWKSVRATIMSNCPGHTDPLCASSLLEVFSTETCSFLLPEELHCLASQSGTSRLDSFTLCLLLKCSTIYLDVLLETLINQVQKSDSGSEDKEVVHRFVRSVVRVFVILSACSSSENPSAKILNRNTPKMQPLKRIQRAFNALLPIAVRELCEMAKALIDPVRLGIARPTSHFPVLPNQTDAMHCCETAFARLPFPPRGYSERKRNERGYANAASTSSTHVQLRETLAPRASQEGSFTQKSSSHPSENAGLLRMISREEFEEREGATAAHDAIQEAFADDLVRINRLIRAEENSSVLEGPITTSFQPLSSANAERNAEVRWHDEDEEDATHKLANQKPKTEDSIHEPQVGSGQADQSHVDGPSRDGLEHSEGTAEVPEDSDDSEQEVMAAAAVEVGDAACIGEATVEAQMVGENLHVVEESDMDLGLLAGSDADTDAGSNQSRVGDMDAQRSNGNGGERQGQILYLEEDEAMSEDVAEEDCDDDDDDEDEDGDNQDADDDDRDTFTRTSDDEAATASEQEGDESTQEDDDQEDSANDESAHGEEPENSPSDWVELPLERAPTKLQRSRTSVPPHSMRWALGASMLGASNSGSRVPDGKQGVHGSSPVGGGMIYIDPLALRRTSAAGVSTAMSTPSGDSGKTGFNMPRCSTATTNSQLARCFGICVREMAALFTTAWKGDHIVNSPPSTFLELSYEDMKLLQSFVEENMSDTWKWLMTVIDSNEAQLRYGQALLLAGSRDHVDHPYYKEASVYPDQVGRHYGRRKGVATFTHSCMKNSRDGNSSGNSDSSDARQDFLTYALSLMRAHSGEHADYLPAIDVSAMRHVAYVLDALIVYLRETASVFDDEASNKRETASTAEKESKSESSLNLGYDNTDDEEEDNARDPPVQESSFPDELYSLAVSDVIVGDIMACGKEELDPAVQYAQPLKTFFKRSESMTFLGCSDPDPFKDALVKALPLADKPHLLQPNARKDELFGRPRQKVGGIEDPSYFDPDLPGTGMGQLKHKIPSQFEKLNEYKVKVREKGTKTDPAKSVRMQVDSNKLESPTSYLQGEDEATVFQSFEPKLYSGSVEHERNPLTQQDRSKNPVESEKLTSEGVPGKSVIVKMEAASNDDVSVELKKIKPRKRKSFALPPIDALLGRCRLTLELFSRVFLDDVGAEPKSILKELGGFEVREAKFRKEMEKLRNSQSVDLQLNVERSPQRLIMQTFKQMNQHFRRRTGCSSALSTTSQPLAVQRVKVVFKDEPGEGSGVARSFYTALCEALLSSEKLPPLDSILVPHGSSSSRHSLIPRLRKREQDKERALGQTGGRKVNLRSYFMARYAQQGTSGKSSSSTSSLDASAVTTSAQMSTISPPFHKHLSPEKIGTVKTDVTGWSRDKLAIGERLLPKVMLINSGWARKITGMLLTLPVSELLLLLSSENMLKTKVIEASQRLSLVHYNGEEEDPFSDSARCEESSSHENMPRSESLHDRDRQNPDSEWETEAEEVDVSTFPLFYQPGKRGFYSPATGPIPLETLKSADPKAKRSHPPGYEARRSAFRNVGRIIGLCLLQNELCPLPLNRHILKAILGRKINWYDFAFFDPVMYESMRFILDECESSENEGLLDALELTFVANLLPEEGGGEIELIPGGTSTKIDTSNVREYVRRYTTYRMVASCLKFIDQIKEGVFDVLPRCSLDGLTAEDLRLLLNGCGRVDVRTLISYTSFNDESGKTTGSSVEKLTEFKRWFWSVVEHMGHSARQELLYFWTGSPALPASEDGFQPLPTVTIRPPDDHHLPSANTCISRLYVPLYSSKTLLKQKLMTAIKTKNFGFV